jgi:hypothetical protein
MNTEPCMGGPVLAGHFVETRPSQPRDDLWRLLVGFRTSQAIHVGATLRIADFLGSGSMSAADLASATSTHPVALYRLMRALAAIQILHEDYAGHFSLTEMGAFLRTDVPGSYVPMAELIGRPYFWKAWGELLHSVRTGTTAFDHVHGRNVWEYRTGHPTEARIFDRAMAAGTEHSAEAVLDAYDFGRFTHVVDIGGGDGMFLKKILKRHLQLRGTLFDQPHVIKGSAEPMSRDDRRYQTVGGNFFNGVPEGGDAYLLKWILHDWDDTAAIDILRVCRSAMAPGARLLVVEHVIGPPNVAPEGKFMDVTMMVMNGGRERTQSEFAALFAKADFRLASIIPTASQLSLIEGEIGSG